MSLCWKTEWSKIREVGIIVWDFWIEVHVTSGGGEKQSRKEGKKKERKLHIKIDVIDRNIWETLT